MDGAREGLTDSIEGETATGLLEGGTAVGAGTKEEGVGAGGTTGEGMLSPVGTVVSATLGPLSNILYLTTRTLTAASNKHKGHLSTCDLYY